MSIKVIGITGGIGCGKSTVAKLIAEAGFEVIETDELAKEIINNNNDVKNKIKEAFGTEAFNSNGSLNTKFISSIVFNENDTEYKALTKLNQIVHLPVIEEMINRIDALEQKGINKVFVESALIYEVELEQGFDYIIAVDCPEEKVIQRLKDKYHMSEKEILLRMKSQIPSSQKAQLADFVINNYGSTDELKKSVDFLLHIL